MKTLYSSAKVISIFLLFFISFNSNAQDTGSVQEVPGCTYANADNYNPDASSDDGSCQFSGCDDPVAQNYNPQANVNDGSCDYIGCMDSLADNFNPLANIASFCRFEGCFCCFWLAFIRTHG